MHVGKSKQYLNDHYIQNQTSQRKNVPMLMHDVKKLLDPVSLSIIFPPQKNLKSFKDINVEVFRINIVNLDFLHTLLYYKAKKKKNCFPSKRNYDATDESGEFCKTWIPFSFV